MNKRKNIIIKIDNEKNNIQIWQGNNCLVSLSTEMAFSDYLWADVFSSAIFDAICEGVTGNEALGLLDDLKNHGKNMRNK